MFANLTVKPLLIACVGLGLALLLALTWGAFQRERALAAEALAGQLHARVDTAEQAVTAANGAIADAARVNKATQRDLDDVAARLVATIGENERIAEASAAARRELAAAHTARLAAAAENTRLKEAIYASDADAAAWAARPVPAGIADRLQDRWLRAGRARPD